MSVSFNEQGIYDPPLHHCPLCGGSSTGRLHTIDRYDPPFAVDQCGDCGFIFMNPRFTPEVIRGFYGEEYFGGNAEYRYYDEREAENYARHVWKSRVAVIAKYAGGGNFLDIGCAFGGLLSVAGERFTPYGIEMSPYAGAHARRLFGDHIHIGTLEDNPFRESMFSVITMIEVLEHLADPVSAVKECRRLLRDGGLLVIQTANMAGLQARILKDRYAYFMPGHLSYFSKCNLIRLLADTGFSKIKAFHPVEFGLLPKLLKSRSSFRSPLDYRHWLRISLYHWLGKLRAGPLAATSSLVLYAFK
ncbi:MAG TPA: class I SAM-dependent methyltransferase [Spirochaetes bacterium]|nr:class I SAM-dependent methyltransferase [Spirochaetota bacterium]